MLNHVEPTDLDEFDHNLTSWPGMMGIVRGIIPKWPYDNSYLQVSELVYIIQPDRWNISAPRPKCLLVAWQTRVLGRFIATAARVSSGNLQQFLWAEVLFIPDLAWHEVCPFSSGWLICKVGIFDSEERLLSQLKWCVSKAFQKLELWFAKVRSFLGHSGTHFQKQSRSGVSRSVCSLWLPWQVIHRDLKPRNLLVNSNCDLKAALKCVGNLGWILN